jgi:hypothetical protein
MDYPNGLVCKFTNKPADFLIKCPKQVKHADPFFEWLHHNADNSQSLYDEYTHPEGMPKIEVEEEEVGGSIILKIISAIGTIISILTVVSECK